MRVDLYSNLAEVEDSHWWFRSRRKIVLTLLRSVHPEGAVRPRILDVGAGTGSTTVALASLGSVDALEMAPDALQHLRRRAQVNVLVGELPHLDLPSGSYEIVTALDVLEHVEDDRGALEEITRVIVPGGHLLLTVPTHPWLWSDFDEACHHFRRYRPEEVNARVRGAGLQIVFSSPIQTVLFPLIAIERLMRRAVRRTQTLSVPPGPLNRLLEAAFSAERMWLSREWRAPFGSSQIVLARKPV